LKTQTKQPSVKQGPDSFRGSLGTAVEVLITAHGKATPFEEARHVEVERKTLT
jgi:hypothetical protein